jgi:sortase A
LAKWNRPRDPRDWRWFVANVGKVLIATGLLLFGFVAYQLWGTGLETARSQRALATEFDEILASTPPPPPVADAEPEPEPDPDPGAQGGSGSGSAQSEILQPDDGIAPAEPEPEPLPEPLVIRGAPIARIEMPTIGVEEIVVSGVAPNDLQKGPGHFPRTPLPGQLGNAAIAGHRTTYGQPFRDVDRLAPGDEIVVTTVQGTFVYRVTGTEIVAPQDSHVVATTDFDVARLTLVSCHPVLSAAQRIIVFAELDLDQSTPAPTTTTGDDAVDDPDNDTAFDDLPTEEVPEAEPAPEPETTIDEPVEAVDGSDDDEPVGTVTDATAAGSAGATAGSIAGTNVPADDELDDAFGRGWFHDRDAFGQIGLWGALLALVSLAAYGLSRATRRDLVGFTVGVAPFAVAAFFFFQNVNRLLPPGL